MTGETIRVYGAREHNLKDITLELPRNALVVFCGVSGSGKSSMAFDTIYAEGQRRYVESLSTHARQVLGVMARPQLDHIDGLSPAIAIDQRSASSSPRSTVGTLTEIHDFLRVLYARLGQPHCYECGKPIGAHTVRQIVDTVMGLPEGARVLVLAPLQAEAKQRDALKSARRAGFVRARVDGEVLDLSDGVDLRGDGHHIEVVVDRLVVGPEIRSRLAESIETALGEADDQLTIAVLGDDAGAGGEDLPFSTRFSCATCGITYPELTPAMFSFNSPQGSCPDCGGLGVREDIDPALFVADAGKSIAEGALAIYGKVRTPHVEDLLRGLAAHYGFDLTVPWKDLPDSARDVVLFGSRGEKVEFSYRTRSGREYQYQREFEGLVPASERRHRETRSQAQKEFLDKFYAPTACSTCGGTRLRRESLSVRIAGLNIAEVSGLHVEACLAHLEGLDLGPAGGVVARELLREVRARLAFMREVGVGYLTLDRAAPTLSGGEAQRIRLATQMGAGLAGVLYILDEPSIGLHLRDHQRLLETLCELRDLGNTVLVVEHDPLTIQQADYLVEFGPGAGVRGGEVTYAGLVKDMADSPRCLTGRYLSGELGTPTPSRRRPGNGQFVEIRGATEHNLKDVDVRFPLGCLICVTGVSGSGKSTLVHDVLYNALRRRLHDSAERPGSHERLLGGEHIDKIVNVDQGAIGRTPRSNPATYSGVFAHIRALYASTPEARVRGYKSGRFSFNVRGGRCEACEGDGVTRIEMHFLPDVYVQCEECRGSRYDRETLQVHYKGKNIAQVLDLTVAEALEHFHSVPPIERVLRTLCDVGLDYVTLGQPATTLSGGEAQRLKLAKELSKLETGRTLYILDEPTTGLHFADIDKLVEVLNRLVDAGNTVVVIEHNLDVIRMADWVVDMGPEGGDAGGFVVAEGTPEQTSRCERSHTGYYLRDALR
jgi:excinuclease ABC subunit A